MEASGAEGQRPAAPRQLPNLNSAAETVFYEFARSAARLLEMPIAFITLTEGDGQWHKAGIGLELRYPDQLRRLCADAIAAGGTAGVSDAALDNRLAGHPLVNAAPHIRFVAAAPLIVGDGSMFGALCVADTRPRPPLSELARGALQALAQAAAAEFTAYRAARSGRLLRERTLDAEARFRPLFEKNPNPMWVYDRETLRFLEVNDAAVELYGWSHDEFREMTLLQIRSTQDTPRLMTVIQELASGRRHHGEWRHVSRDGRVFDVLVAAYGMEYEGRPAALVVVHDISARKRVEQALNESESRFRNIADSIPGLVWVDDPSGETVFVNSQWLAYTGRKLEDEIGDGWQQVVHPDDLDSAVSAIRRAGEATRAYEAEYRLRRHDGVYRWFLDTGSPRFSPDGSFLGFIGILLDLTERRRLETELRQAQKMQAIGQLTGGIAHDFNNLLCIILGTTELLAEETGDDARLNRLLQITREAADRGAGLVRRLLGFSRFQPRQLEIVDINELVRDMEQLLLRTLGEDIEVVLSLQQGLFPVRTDREQLETALLNLAINARDAMAAGGRLLIETRNLASTCDGDGGMPGAAAGDCAAIAVIDDGIGMSAEVAARAFEPFFTTKEAGRGSGLGLSMVYGFVAQSGGQVGLESEPGRGARVEIRLPRAAAETWPLSAPDRQQPLPTGAGQVVLLVEDDALVRDMLADHLVQLAYEVATAEDGPSALAVLQQGPEIDLLLTDMVMPKGMNGRQLAEAALAHHAGLRVLFMSGYTDDHVTLSGELPGTGALLRKPFTKRTLAEALRATRAARAA